MVLSCQPFFETQSWNISNFVSLKPLLKDSLKQKVNVPKTEWQMYGCHEPYLQIFTRNLTLSGSSQLLCRYLLLLLGLRFCSAVQLGISLGPKRARQATMIERTAPASPFIRNITCRKSWKIKLFQKPVGRIAKASSIDHIFMQPSVLRKGTSLGEIF